MEKMISLTPLFFYKINLGLLTALIGVILLIILIWSVILILFNHHND